MALRLEPKDEYMHELGPEPNFNESMYFNLYDPSQRIGGFWRLGNRANEGQAEMTVCLYLPDGRVAFMFGRPPITSNDAFDAGGLRIEVMRPFEELHVSYRGRVVLLERPLEMADPKAAFTQNPHEDCQVAVTFTNVSTPFGGEPEEAREPTGEEFARGHYEQLIAGEGTIAVGEQSWDLRGYGLRDHSWGPRYWQAPWYYRWLTANFGPSFGFMGSRIARREGPGTRGGFVWDGTVMKLVDDIEIKTSWAGEDCYHDGIEATLRTRDKEWHVRGKVISLIPLRNRRDAMVTRISEGLTEWSLDDGRVGYGMSEYLDQIVDGRPVGIDE
jgi:hypothetical protein